MYDEKPCLGKKQNNYVVRESFKFKYLGICWLL